MPQKLHSRAGKLPFATTSYEADHEGVFRPQLPSQCLYATGAQSCCIVVDHYRSRKTGPCYPIAVIGCRVHPYGRYTLYPPGHVPYGRRAVAPYHPSGQLMVDPESRKPPWEATLFAAALDAAQGERWPVEGRWFGQPDPRRRQTQGRTLQRAGRLVGVHAQLDETLRERIATRLAVPTMKLIEGAGSWDGTWKRRGEAIQAVLAGLPGESSLLDRLLEAGALAGLWGPPYRWEARRRRWVQRHTPGSRGSEHHGEGGSRSRAPPSTKVTDPPGP